MTEELITRLRAVGTRFKPPTTVEATLLEAADALEAAQADLGEMSARWANADAGASAWRHQAEVWMNAVADAVEPLGFDRAAACGPADLIPGLRWLVENEAKARAERDAEAALADQLAVAVALLPHDPMCAVVGGYEYPCNCGRDAALTAHRERRTAPTKEPS